MATKYENQRRVTEITHFWENKRSNALTVQATDPFLKDSKWVTSGSISLMISKYDDTGKHEKSTAIKLTISETCELIKRLEKELDNQIEKEEELSQS